MNNKVTTIFIACIASFSFLLSQWLLQKETTTQVFGFSQDALAGISMGLGIGFSLILLKVGVTRKNN